MENSIESIEFDILKRGNMYCEIIDLVADVLDCNTEKVNMFKVVKSIKDNPQIKFCELLKLGMLV